MKDSRKGLEDKVKEISRKQSKKSELENRRKNKKSEPVSPENPMSE